MFGSPIKSAPICSPTEMSASPEVVPDKKVSGGAQVHHCCVGWGSGVDNQKGRGRGASTGTFIFSAGETPDLICA